MQEELKLQEASNFQEVDEMRCKCLVCEKVIYKILIKAHWNSHSIVPIIPRPKEFQARPMFNGVKKVSLNAIEANSTEESAERLQKTGMSQSTWLEASDLIPKKKTFNETVAQSEASAKIAKILKQTTNESQLVCDETIKPTKKDKKDETFSDLNTVFVQDKKYELKPDQKLKITDNEKGKIMWKARAKTKDLENELKTIENRIKHMTLEQEKLKKITKQAEKKKQWNQSNQRTRSKV